MGPKILAGRFSRSERIKRRRFIDLEDSALTDQTRARYYSALRKILPALERALSLEGLDETICEWIHEMWRSGEPLLTIGDALSAVHFWEPWTKRRLSHSWKLFHTWRKIEVPNRAPPLTAAIVESWAAYEFLQGHLNLSLLLMLSFHCLLRTGEALAVTGLDFDLGPKVAILTLRFSKSGKRNAAKEMVTISDAITLELLRLFLAERRLQGALGSPIWIHSASLFRRRFNELAKIFHMQHLNFRPYSLRRGGATAWFSSCQSMESTLLRGRWSSSQVAKIYIADALAHLPEIRMSSFSQSMLSKYNFQTLR